MRQNLILTLVLLGLVLMTTSYEFSKFRVNNKVQNQQQPYAEVCNITHFEFQSNVSLGKNDELNKTFAKLGQKINALNDVTWKVNNSVTYKIYGANPTFYYRDSKQKAEIVSNDTIVIAGGVAEVSIDFKWQKSGDVTKTGTGSVSGLSEIIEFAKQIVIDGDFFKYQLLDYINITFSTPMKLNRIDPATTTKEQQEDILKLVNNIANVTTLRHELQDDIALYYAFYLKMNLHDESMPIDEHFFYKWSSPISSKGDLIVNFTRRPAFIDIERDGIHYGYEAKIDNWNNSKCTAMPPILPLDPKAYGGSQEFISFGFYQNILRYAIEKGQIDTQLTKDLWESRMFQFTAGDLYEVFPQFASMYLARTDVTGDCKTNASQVKIYKGGENTFNTTIRSSCQLSVNRTKFIGFQVRLELEIEGKPTADYVDFGLKSHTEFVTYYDTFGFKLENNLLADQMVKHSLNRLYQGKFFGSGWPLHPQRDYPHFVTEHDATLVYDSTHVNLSLEQ